MKKSIKYIISILLIVLCLFLIWSIFIKKDPRLEALEKNILQEQLPPNNIDDSSNSNDNNNNSNENSNTSDKVVDEKPIINDELVKPKDDSKVIISSETEMLNEKGEELLNELSKQLEQSLSTIQSTNGIIDDEVFEDE